MFRRSSSAVATSREDPPRRSDRARGVGGSDQRASAAEPVLPFLKAKRAGGRGASTLANASDLAPVVLGLGNSLLTTASGQGEKPTACHHQPGSPAPTMGPGTTVGVDNARCAIDQYVGHEDDALLIRLGEGTNRCIQNVKRDRGDARASPVARWAVYSKTESPEVRSAIHCKRPGNPHGSTRGFVDDIGRGAGPIDVNIADIRNLIAPVSAKKVKFGPDTAT